MARPKLQLFKDKEVLLSQYNLNASGSIGHTQKHYTSNIIRYTLNFTFISFHVTDLYLIST